MSWLLARLSRLFAKPEAAALPVPRKASVYASDALTADLKQLIRERDADMRARWGTDEP